MLKSDVDEGTGERPQYSKCQLAQEFTSPPKQVCIISWIKRCGIELVSFMTFMFEEYVRLVLFVERFPVKQCLIAETVYFFGNFCHSYRKTL